MRCKAYLTGVILHDHYLNINNVMDMLELCSDEAL